MKNPLLKAAGAAVVAAAVAGAVAVQQTSFAGTAPAAPAAQGIGSAAGVAAAARRPNIVFVLTDDLSMNLVQFMPQVQQMRRDGMSFTNMTVTDSLCCPSRSSIFTGMFPHNTKVQTNDSPDGGFAKFVNTGDEKKTFATSLQNAGYRTGFMGKYLNGYHPEATINGQNPYVPPGWDQWAVAGKGYEELGYSLAVNHRIEKHGEQDNDYLVDVMARKGTGFIADAARADKPFMLELATFAPHHPYTPATRDENDFPGLTAPTGPSYDKKPTNAPKWLKSVPKLTDKKKARMDDDFRLRAQAVQSVDDMIRDVRQQLRQSGVAGNTYLVFSSDNGYHMGEHGMFSGKMTAFDTDVNVPLVVVGPGVRAGSSNNEQVANIDFAPTFEQIGNAHVGDDVDGHSFLGLLHGDGGNNWRTATLIEHKHPAGSADDPDRQDATAGNPPTYHALRTSAFTYVSYAGGAKEYYDRQADPLQLDNKIDSLSHDRIQRLEQAVDKLRRCSGNNCWTAGHL